MFVRIPTALLALAVLTGKAVAAPPPPPALPSAQAIALIPADIPTPALIGERYSVYYSPKQLNSDTVPQGLSVKHLRHAGFRGLYTQTLQRPNDDVPYGYPWNYLAFPNAASAHRMWAEWVRNTKKPFNFPKGSSHVADECRAYQSVISVHEIGLLCRSGPYVVFGHYRSKASVESMMQAVVLRARRIRP